MFNSTENERNLIDMLLDFRRIKLDKLQGDWFFKLLKVITQKGGTKVMESSIWLRPQYRKTLLVKGKKLHGIFAKYYLNYRQRNGRFVSAKESFLDCVFLFQMWLAIHRKAVV
jgi:hypothetical protein